MAAHSFFGIDCCSFGFRESLLHPKKNPRFHLPLLIIPRRSSKRFAQKIRLNTGNPITLISLVFQLYSYFPVTNQILHFQVTYQKSPASSVYVQISFEGGINVSSLCLGYHKYFCSWGVTQIVLLLSQMF